MDRIDLKNGDIVDHRYEVIKLLGEGGFGQVFLAKDINNGQNVAFKILKMWGISPGEREKISNRFEMEYETSRISSPYLVHSLGKGEYHGNPYIVMEYCEGGDLASAMKKQKIDLVLVATQILLGLEALHREGKVHRDLKPENVLIRADGTAVLTDFGISGDRNHRLTSTGILGIPKEIMGTIIYMPPEQAKPMSGKATVLPTTDIFSFGVMMYQLLTGRLPFGTPQSSNDVERYSENMRNGRWDRRRLKKVADGEMWMNVIEGCLQPNYKKRLQSARDVLLLIPTVNLPESDSVPTERGPIKKWVLKIMQGEEAGRVYELIVKSKECNVLRMGRQTDSSNNDIPIAETKSTYISRTQCTLEWDGSESCWYIWDGQWVDDTRGGYWKASLNGTYVGSKKATTEDPIALCAGNIIAIGDVTIKVIGERES